MPWFQGRLSPGAINKPDPQAKGGCSVLVLPSGGGEDALCPLNTGKSVLLVCLCPTGVKSIFPSNGHCLLKELFVAVLFWQELYRGQEREEGPGEVL